VLSGRHVRDGCDDNRLRKDGSNLLRLHAKLGRQL
jgi:hypothetical protein